jgi:hypothetical protein
MNKLLEKIYLLLCLIVIALTACTTVQKATPEQRSEKQTTIVPTDSPLKTPTIEVPETSQLENASPRPLPKLINHSKPNIQVDLTSFLAASDCQLQAKQLQGCTQLKKQMGCEDILLPNPLWGAITPKYPIVTCLVFTYQPTSKVARSQLIKQLEQLETQGYFLRVQGKSTQYIRYVIFKAGTFQLIKNIDELKQTFAPIETPAEALSYALLATPFQAYYQQTLKPNYRYYTDTIEDTHVITNDDGFLSYQVLLYTQRHLGCGSHPISTIPVLVKSNGLVSYPSQQLAYADPAEDELCVE